MKDEEEEVRKTGSFQEYLGTAQDTIKVFRWFWKEIIPIESKKKLRGMFIWLGITIIVSGLQPFAMGFVFTGLARSQGRVVLAGMASFAALLIILKTIDRFQQRCREWVMGLNWEQMDDRISELFFEKSMAQHTHEGTRLSVSSINKGKSRFIDMQGLLLFDGIPTIIQLAVSIVFLLCLSFVSGCVMALLIAIYVVWSLYLNFRVALVCTPIEKDWRKLNRRRDERWEKVERVKVCGHEKLEVQEMTATFEGIIRRDMNFWLWFIDVATLRSLVNSLCLIICASWGVWLVWKGAWGIGLLYPLLSWATRVSENAWKLGDIEHKVSWNMPSVKLMIEALEIPPAIVDREGAIGIDYSKPHRIEFDEISHTYSPESKADDASESEPPAALINVSFVIEPGEKVAVIGPSGAGKSTLMKKLLRFEDPTAGSVKIGSIDLRDISMASFRKGVGYIAQRDQVFDGTIRSNLVYSLDPKGREAVTDAELWQLMELLQIDFGKRLTNGLDTVVGKNGLKLSGGQAQRLMIGAAVIKRPWLLVVDEATASLDSSTEKLVQEGLAKVLAGNTSALIVAHRLSTVRRLCSKFVILKPAEEVKEGESQVEAIAGSFEDLYEVSPTFRRLADDQGVVIRARHQAIAC
ncbi:MAG: ABC transporter ATP-binding protein [Patescibacteria group bacterium]|nr:ABC transporter ATP-binding protein [Patescibacteria group bacterium]MDE2116786.1 ABC transporter ATP-binding protein [Patescibacteria group bacterium]